MIDIIEELEMVNAVTDGFPFLCCICEQEHRDWDYLRIHLRGNPNPRCIHLKCLLNQVGFSPEAIEIARALRVEVPEQDKRALQSEITAMMERVFRNVQTEFATHASVSPCRLLDAIIVELRRE